MTTAFNSLSRLAQKAMPTTPIPDSIIKFIPFRGETAIMSGAIEFQVPPQEITESKSTKFNSQDIFGRFEPIRVYSSSDPTNISFTMMYYWLEDSFFETIGSWEGIHKNIKKLKAFTYPIYSANENLGDGISTSGIQGTELISRLAPPPTLHFWYGDIFKNVQCIVKAINITYKGPWNDNSLASKAQRIADATGVTFNNKTVQKISSIISTGLEVASTAASFIPSGIGSRAGLIGAVQSFLERDMIFPLMTEINVTLETNYPINWWQTYDEIAEVDSNQTQLIGKTVQNSEVGVEQRSFQNSAIRAANKALSYLNYR